jgi:hypothetical protein
MSHHTGMESEMVVVFNQLSRLIAQEDVIKHLTSQFVLATFLFYFPYFEKK